MLLAGYKRFQQGTAVLFGLRQGQLSPTQDNFEIAFSVQSDMQLETVVLIWSLCQSSLSIPRHLFH